MVRERGLVGLSLRELGGRVGMRAQSLYSYFTSKNEIYDAMFRQGYETFMGEMALPPAPNEPTNVLAFIEAGSLRFFDFCVSDPVRYQLLFQRTIPDFEPSPESWALALRAYDRGVGGLRQLGFDDESLDMWTAVLTGLTDQQISNDPGGTRWRRQVPRAVRMLVTEFAPHLVTPPRARPRRKATR